MNILIIFSPPCFRVSPESLSSLLPFCLVSKHIQTQSINYTKAQVLSILTGDNYELQRSKRRTPGPPLSSFLFAFQGNFLISETDRKDRTPQKIEYLGDTHFSQEKDYDLAANQNC